MRDDWEWECVLRCSRIFFDLHLGDPFSPLLLRNAAANAPAARSAIPNSPLLVGEGLGVRGAKRLNLA